MAQKPFAKPTREVKASAVIRRVDDLGRVSIPKDFRRKLGIADGSALECQMTKEGILLTPYRSAEDIGSYLDFLEDLLVEDAGEFDPEVRSELRQHLKDCQALLRKHQG